MPQEAECPRERGKIVLAREGADRLRGGATPGGGGSGPSPVGCANPKGCVNSSRAYGHIAVWRVPLPTWAANKLEAVSNPVEVIQLPDQTWEITQEGVGVVLSPLFTIESRHVAPLCCVLAC